jgi:hypothetical protein
MEEFVGFVKDGRITYEHFIEDLLYRQFCSFKGS